METNPFSHKAPARGRASADPEALSVPTQQAAPQWGTEEVKPIWSPEENRESAEEKCRPGLPHMDYKSSFGTVLNISRVLLALWKHISSLLYSHLFPMLDYKHLLGSHIFKTCAHCSCIDQLSLRKALFIHFW